MVDSVLSVASTGKASGPQSLSSFFASSSAVEYQLMARPGNNLGNPTLIFSIPMADFHRMSIIANNAEKGEVAQRKLDPGHAFKLGQFILKGLVGTARTVSEQTNSGDSEVFDRILHNLTPQVYTAMQPMVVNIRTAGLFGASLRYERFPSSGPLVGASVYLGQRDLLYVVDGQHRRQGIHLVLEFLDELLRAGQYSKGKSSLYPYGETREAPPEELEVWQKAYEMARSLCTVAVEAHLGLNVEQEKQLFYDLNSRTKAVEKSLGLDFDSANPVNQFSKTALIETGLIRLARGDKMDWDADDTGGMTRKDLTAVNAHLFLNKTNINGATAADVDMRRPVVQRFWEAVTQAEGFGDEQARDTTLLAQPVMLKALAKLTFDFAFGRAKLRNEEHLNALLDQITDIDFKHDNPVWRYFEMSENERKAAGIDGLSDYLPTGLGNRDIGAVDSKTGKMRFGAKHNDIYPILGDMVRFQLGLPRRPESEAKKLKASEDAGLTD